MSAGVPGRHVPGAILVAGFLAVGAVVLAGLVAIGRHVVGGLGPERRVPVDVVVHLTPDDAGTRVDVEERARSGTLPPTLAFGLQSIDRGRLDTGEQLTHAALVYSNVRDGRGRPVPASNGRYTVPTDGRVVRLSFHVDAVRGRRIVYPVPGMTATGWQTVRIPARPRCATSYGANQTDPPVFTPCTPSGTLLDSAHHDWIRLELP
jgi:hypothetical protein